MRSLRVLLLLFLVRVACAQPAAFHGMPVNGPLSLNTVWNGSTNYVTAYGFGQAEANQTYVYAGARAIQAGQTASTWFQGVSYPTWGVFADTNSGNSLNGMWCVSDTNDMFNPSHCGNGLTVYGNNSIALPNGPWADLSAQNLTCTNGNGVAANGLAAVIYGFGNTNGGLVVNGQNTNGAADFTVNGFSVFNGPQLVNSSETNNGQVTMNGGLSLPIWGGTIGTFGVQPSMMGNAALNNGGPPIIGFNGFSVTPAPTETWFTNTMNVLLSVNATNVFTPWIVLDDNWQDTARRPNGNLFWRTSSFPDGLTFLCATAHSLGFKVGLYTEPAVTTSAGNPGSADFIDGTGYGVIATNWFNDCSNFLAWGIDGVRFQNVANATFTNYHAHWFSYETAMLLTNAQMIATNLALPHKILSLIGTEWLTNNPPPPSTISGNEPYVQGGITGRGGDVLGWPGDLDIANYQLAYWPNYWGPGHFNGTIINTTTTGPVPDSIAPLAAIMAWEFETTITNLATIHCFSNADVMNIWEDPLGIPAVCLSSNLSGMVLARPLTNNDFAVAFINNFTNTSITLSFQASQIGLPSKGYIYGRDAVAQTNFLFIGGFTNTFTTNGMLFRVGLSGDSFLGPQVTGFSSGTWQRVPQLYGQSITNTGIYGGWGFSNLVSFTNTVFNASWGQVASTNYTVPAGHLAWLEFAYTLTNGGAFYITNVTRGGPALFFTNSQEANAVIATNSIIGAVFDFPVNPGDLVGVTNNGPVASGAQLRSTRLVQFP